MKQLLPFTLAILLVCSSCSSATELREISPVDSSSLFGVSGEFTAIVEHQDVGITSSRLIMQNEESGLFYYYDGTNTVLCSNIEKIACYNAEGELSEEDRDTALRVTSKTARRLLANEYTFTDYQELESTTPPRATTALPLQATPETIAPYIDTEGAQSLDSCILLFKENKQEKETLCYGPTHTTLYAFTQGSTVAPVTILRQLTYFKETPRSQEEMKNIFEDLRSTL